MTRTVEESTRLVLSALAAAPRDEMGHGYMTGDQLAEATRLSPAEINDAVSMLVASGYAEWMRFLGTAPFGFGFVTITPRGRYEFERVREPRAPTGAVQQTAGTARILRPPTPVGSPYGFQDEDWETVSLRKSDSVTLFVVLGYQFQSHHYESSVLRQNVEAMFRDAIDAYNQLPTATAVTLAFRTLAAGYGGHLFNEIARDIISADIAVFETSDLNPNVMLEMGVALTWDVRVLPIKLLGQPEPPSDISGQTWADYENSASRFVFPDHSKKLLAMVERAARKKQSGST